MSDSISIRCAPNGPYLLKGPAVIVDPTGQELKIPEGKNAALCRCGHSATKPFCDGAHGNVGFQASEPGKAP